MPTNDPDPARVQAVFLSAAEIADAVARAAFVAESCGDDRRLRARVEALLHAHEQPDSLLDGPRIARPDSDTASTRAFDPVSHAAGTRPGTDEAEGVGEQGARLETPSTRPDSLGRIGQYEILQVLGRGGFGIVYRAFDDSLQRVVAIKVMAPQVAVTSPARKRFLREARSSAQVRHENVVQVYEVGEAPLPYLVMEFIPGETLQQRLDRTGPLDVPELLRIGRQIAEGLAAAHATDLIHRDIKPANVLIEGGLLRVKITDFGLARAADDASISQSGLIAGTPMYMAPEQAKGEPLDHRADLFSLGSVLYQMTAGRPPFRATGTLAVLKRVAEDRPRPIREIIPEAPQWLCDVISKLHAKDPADRFQSAREVADVLADCEAQLKTHPKLRDYSRIPRGRPTPRAGGLRRLLAVGLPLILLTAVAVFVRVGPRGRAETANNDEPGDGTPPAVVAPVRPVPGPVPAPLPPALKNGLGMEFVVVPKGKSWLGGGKDHLGDRAVDFPADFYLGKYEVTQEEWETVMGANPSEFKRGIEAVKDIPDAALRRFPVENVTWHQCQLFLETLNRREKDTGWVYRLPTRAEWEYACRGGPMADKLNSAYDFYLDKPANTLLSRDGNFGHDDGMKRTCPVGSYRPNPLGLFDLHGNVWEWCLDAPSDPADADSASKRFIAGGSCLSAAQDSTAGYQNWEGADKGMNRLGLRLARVPAGTAFLEVHGVTRDGLREWAAKLPTDYRPTWISARVSAGVRFDAVATHQPGSREWKISVGTDGEDKAVHKLGETHRIAACGYFRFENEWEYFAQGVLDYQDGHEWQYWYGDRDFIGGKIADGGKGERTQRGVKQRWRPTCVAADTDGRSSNYTLTMGWQPDVACEWHPELSADELSEKVAGYRENGWRPHSIRAHINRSPAKFVAVFTENTTNEAWDFTPGLPAEEYETQLIARKANGQHPRCVSSYGPDEKLRYAVVWDGGTPGPK